LPKGPWASIGLLTNRIICYTLGAKIRRETFFFQMLLE